jgi:hypothetical protein
MQMLPKYDHVSVCDVIILPVLYGCSLEYTSTEELKLKDLKRNIKKNIWL